MGKFFKEINLVSKAFSLAFILLGLAFFYQGYQLRRNSEILTIRLKLINEGKFGLVKKTSYEQIFYPNKSNWYGLKFPSESDYK